MILAAVDRQRRRRMVLFDKRQDISRALVDGHPATHEAGIGDHDRLAPSLAPVFAALQAHPVLAEYREDRAVGSDREIGETATFENLLDLEFRLAHEGLERPFEFVLSDDWRTKREEE